MALTIYKIVDSVRWRAGSTIIRPTSGGSMYVEPTNLSNYYTKTELNVDGGSTIHFGNIIEAYHNNLLDIQGGLDTSSGDSSGNDAEYYHLDATTYYDIINIDFQMSLIKDSINVVTLVNDVDTPGNSYYYGTDSGGTKGWFILPTPGSTLDSSGLAYVSAYGTPVNNQIAIWVDEDTIEGSPNLSYDGRTFVFGGYPIDIPDAGFTNISIGTILEGYIDGEGNVFIGLYAGSFLSGGNENVGIGSNALTSIDSGNNNVAIGYNSLGGLTSANRNIAIGSYTLANSTEGESNIAFGYETMESCLGSYNIGIGDTAIRFLSDGSNNIAIGYKAGLSTISVDQGNLSGSDNIYIGVDTKAFDSGQINEIVIGSAALGHGSNTTTIGSIDTIATYLAGEIYFITYDSSGGNDTTGSLPLADSAITQVVMYDPDTGKLYYGAGTGGDIVYTFGMSLNEDSVGVVTLDNDLASPGNDMYYGTNATGVKGWNALTKGFQTESFANPLEIDCTTYKDWICTLTGDCTININNCNDGDSGMLELIIDGSSSGDTLTVTFGTMWTKKMGPTDFDGTDGADNIISWRAIGDGSTQEIVYTIGIIE